MRPLVVIGAGGFGRETLDVIAACNADHPQWEVLGVVDDAPAPVQRQRLEARGVAWLGTQSDFCRRHPLTWFVTAIGAPAVRERVTRAFAEYGHRPATVIHPSATLGFGAVIGHGSVVCAGAQVSTNVRIGSHVHVNPNATIGHDSILDDYVSINPGAVVSGEVRVGAKTLVGAGAVILQGLAVGHEVTVGAAACVTRDIPAGRTVIGIPAR